MTKTITFHVGTRRTGTTALQQACLRHRALLEGSGLGYPEAGLVEGAHHGLAGALLEMQPGDPRSPPPPHERIDQVPAWQELVAQIGASPLERFLVSSEEFERLSAPQSVADYLRASLPGVALGVLVYVRRQDSYLESLYQQQVRDFRSRVAEPFGAWLRRPGFIHYDALVDRWERAFGPGSVTLRVYEDEARGGLVEGFLGALGVPADVAAQAKSDPENYLVKSRVSLDARCTEFMRLCNREPIDREHHEIISRCLIDVSARIAKREGRLATRTMELSQRVRLLHDVAESNARLRERFFPAKRALFPAPALDGKDSPLSVNEIVQDLLAAGLF
jgi:hypothetical protein